MRRPILILLFSAAAGVLIGYSALPLIIKLAICAAFPAALLFCRKVKTDRRKLLICGLAFAVFTAGFVRMTAVQGKKSIFADKEGQVAAISGVITEAQVKQNYIAVTVLAEDRGLQEKVLVKLKTDDPELTGKCYELVGRTVFCQGTVSFPDGARNPGAFDYAKYLKGKNIRCILTVSEYRFLAKSIKRPVLNMISAAKGRFLAEAQKYMGNRQFSVLAGLLFGEKGYLDEESYAEFQELGIAHVLAVSGLHVGLLYAVILKLLGNKRNAVSTIVTVLSLFVYAAISDFSVSVLRASFMVILNLAAFHLKRRYDLVCSASFCAICFLLVNPYQIFDSGFQLSFLAAYSIGVALPWAENKLVLYTDRIKKEWITRLGEVLVPCVVVQLGMQPLLLFNFMNFSFLTVFLNPFAVALAALLLPAGLAFFAAFLLMPAKAPLLLAAAAGPANGFAGLLLQLTRIGTKLGGGMELPAPPPGLVILYYVLFFWFFSETRYIVCRRGRQNAAAAISLALCFGACIVPFAAGYTVSPLPWIYNDYTVCFLDVGQGDCIHIQSGGKNILIDGGGSYRSNIAEKTLKPYFLKNGVTHIDIAIVSHMDNDHSKGVAQLSEIMPIETLILPVCESGNINDIRASRTLYASRGMHIEAGSAVFDVISPYFSADAAGSEDKNNSCIVSMLTIDGIKILFTGDLEQEGETRLLYDTDLDCDILKVGHHGSSGSTGENFLKAASPDFAVISCGRKNIYGHPSERVIDLLSDSSIIYSRTDLYGAVCLRKHRGSRIFIENAAKDHKWSIPSEQ